MKKRIYGLLILVLVFTVLVVPRTKVKGEGTCELPIDESSTIEVKNNKNIGVFTSHYGKPLTKEDIFDYVDLSITTAEGEKECRLYNDDFEVVSGLDEINSYIEAKEEDQKEVTIVFRIKDSNFTFNVTVLYAHEGTTPLYDNLKESSINYDYKNGELNAEKVAKLANIPKKINNGSIVVPTNYYFMWRSNLISINEAIKNQRTGTFRAYLYFGYDNGEGDNNIYGCFITINIINGKAVVNTSTSKPENNDKNGYVLGIMIIALGGISTIIIKKKKTITK